MSKLHTDIKININIELSIYMFELSIYQAPLNINKYYCN